MTDAPLPKDVQLQQGEQVELSMRPNWAWYLVSRVHKLAASLVPALVAMLLGWWLWMVALAFVPVTYVLLLRWVWATTIFVVTNLRVVERKGLPIIARNGREIPLDRVNDQSHSSTWAESWFSVGDLTISSLNGAPNRFLDITHPETVATRIGELRRSNGTRAIESPIIAKARRMHAKGLLTDADLQQVLDSGQ